MTTTVLVMVAAMVITVETVEATSTQRGIGSRATAIRQENEKVSEMEGKG